ncbi:hypothetical protein CcCBS67573_g07085 [Chytriomyces confervae]|uniref:Uncharacterized protein n=1 Tax=Chytriomyces confervae TaxID=246404 RepID=A0A507EXP7_9FUNG|nr:hypothetical protein CcCBS67573_g07085 [Chytriomyces confervae]
MPAGGTLPVRAELSLIDPSHDSTVSRSRYVATTESTGRTGCPLKTGNCPYYTQHAKDASVADYLTAKDGKCPLEGKCPFYKDLKDGKTVDLTGSNCPIKDTWCEQFPEQFFVSFASLFRSFRYHFNSQPQLQSFEINCSFLLYTTRTSPYYKTVKSHGNNVECPLEKSCPYLKKQKESANPKESTPDAEPKKCPMKGKCPYADKHGSANEDGSADCPLKDGGCPYYNDHAGDKELAIGDGCPLKDKCPYYEACMLFERDIKSGKTVDFSKNDCPLADKCPYYKEAKEKGADGGCPATKGCPHFNKDIPASGDVKKCPYHQKSAEKDAKSGGCPLHQKCPYVDEHHAKHGEGCPLEKGGCPYYSEHKDDKDVGKMLTHEGGCPLKEKCPYYEDVKSGKKIDLTGSNCPLSEKCPYYKEVKDGGDVGCPMTKGCPRMTCSFVQPDTRSKSLIQLSFHANLDLNKDIEKTGDVKKCPYHAKKDADAGEQKKSACPLHGKCPYVDNHHSEHGKGCPLQNGGCPYFNEHKGDKSIADVLSHDGGCPLKEKCPYYEDMKSGKKVDFSGNKCPLAEKCPYYKEVKEGGVSPDCPLEKYFKKDFEKGGHAHHGGKGDSHDSKDCPYLKKHAKTSEKAEGHDEL